MTACYLAAYLSVLGLGTQHSVQQRPIDLTFCCTSAEETAIAKRKISSTNFSLDKARVTIEKEAPPRVLDPKLIYKEEAPRHLPIRRTQALDFEFALTNYLRSFSLILGMNYPLL